MNRSCIPPSRWTWIVALSLLLGGSLGAAEYFLAPDGDDANAGTIAAPFASFARAQQAVAAGDTVQVRGGTYRMTEAQLASRKRIWAYGVVLDKSGSDGRHITYQAYEQERPVFDFSAVKPAGCRVTAFFVTGSWLHLKGIEVTGVQVTLLGHTQSECFDNQGSNNLYEMLSMHDGQAIGFWLGRGSNNLVLNCDAFRNYDYTSENQRGGNVDGFGGHPAHGSVNNVFRGCRAWFNSDDGFDLIGAGEAVTIENCWALYNGYGPQFENLGDGNGFKAGGYGSAPADRLPAVIPRHIVRGCLAVRNKASGFYANHHPGGNDWLNNTAYRNGTNFNLLGRLRDNRTDVPGIGHKLRNNLSFQSRRDLSNLDPQASDAQANSFDLPVKIEAKDFASLDEAELVQPRGPEGALPRIHCLHLAPGSALIDRGEDTGLPFKGAAPDLGAFESDPDESKAR